MVAVALWLAGCLLPLLFEPSRAPAVSAVAGQVVMGTVLEVVVEAATRKEAEKLAEEAIAIARHWEDVLSTFRPEAELARLHRWRGQRIYASSDLLTALWRMETLVEQTVGAFDPTYPAKLSGGNPAQTTIELGSNWVCLGAAAQVDPGAVGKGIALDAIVAWLKTQGAHEVFLNFGGSSFTHATQVPSAGQVRKVLLASAEGAPLAVVPLRAASLSVSLSGRRDDASPVYEPWSGTAVLPGRLAATVAQDATSADAWSTALVVLGRSGLDLARSHGIEAFVADHDSAAWTEHFPLVPLEPLFAKLQKSAR